MTISVPVAQELVATNILDATSFFNPAINMSYPTGSTIQKDGWIWENTGENIVPTVWVSPGNYPDGTVVYKDGKLQLWYSSPTQRLAQPEEYTTIDNGKYTDGNLFKADTWTNKYVNLGSVPLNQTLYDPDFVGLPADASAYLYTTWIDDQGVTQIQANVTPESALGESPYSIQAPNIYTELNENTVETKSSLYVHDNKLVGTIGSIFMRGTDMYMRTAVDANTEYIDVTDGYGVDITSVEQLVGFTKKEPILAMYPFDNKNYTLATKQTTMTYTVKGTKKFDTIALGRIKADSIVVDFKDTSGTVITHLEKTIDGSRDQDGNLDAWHTTVIYYSTEVMEANSTVEITISGANIELGSLLLGMSVDAGFTNLAISNKYKDFSLFQQNTFGFMDYVEREKVSTYNGSVDIPITDYDRIDRLMTSLGGIVLIVNGSKSKTKSPDSQTVFASTQKIGRLFNFESKTKIEDKDIGRMATYTFRLEERV